MIMNDDKLVKLNTKYSLKQVIRWWDFKIYDDEVFKNAFENNATYYEEYAIKYFC